MGATISSSDAETRFFMPDEMAIVSVKAVLNNSMRATHSIYYLGATITESENKISKDSFAFKEAANLTLLEAFKHLNENWNGYGAKKFDAAFIENVKQIVLNLDFPPKIYPTGRNSIQLEYEKKNGNYLEFEIYQDGKISSLRIINDEETEKDIDIANMNGYISDFYAI